MLFVLLTAMAMLNSVAAADEAASKPTESGLLGKSTLFTENVDGYVSYRIPAVVVTKKGTVLAFCEGRANPRGPLNDTGEIHLLLRRSTDGGKTFSPQQVVWQDGKNTCGNPCPVVDRSTGTIWMLMTHNLGEDREPELTHGTSKGTRTVWVTSSDDDGITWASPREITNDIKKPEWTWYATGPGVGIQMEHGPHAGRLVIPCDYVTKGGDPDKSNSHVIYSDDHGKTWKLGGEPATTGYNESQIVELEGGKLMLNMRNIARKPPEKAPSERGVAISNDGGETFGAAHHDPTLIEPHCQASIVRYTWAEQGKSRILFANPASTTRKKMTVRLSYDEGTTWPVQKQIFDGWTGYSSIVPLPDGSIGLLVEAGEKEKYERIDFIRFTLDWLTDGADHGEASAPSSIRWDALPDLPDPLGLAGAFVGECNGAVLFAGGANFPDAPPWRGGKKVFSDRAYLLTNENRWPASPTRLPQPIAYGATISTDRGVIMIGGCNGSQCSAEVTRATWDGSGTLKFTALPSLPHPVAFATAALVGNTIYVIGGQQTVADAKSMADVIALDLSKEGSTDFRWQAITPLPGAPRILAVSVAQVVNGRPSLFVFSGRNVQAGQPTELLSDAYRLDVISESWQSLPPILIDGSHRCIMAGNAVATDDGGILLLGGDAGETFAQAEKLQDKQELARLFESHPGFSTSVIRYDPARATYSVVGEMPHPSPVTTPCVVLRNEVILASGEARAGIRTPKVWRAMITSPDVQARGSP
jgi:sialidase-1